MQFLKNDMKKNSLPLIYSIIQHLMKIISIHMVKWKRHNTEQCIYYANFCRKSKKDTWCTCCGKKNKINKDYLCGAVTGNMMEGSGEEWKQDFENTLYIFTSKTYKWLPSSKLKLNHKKAKSTLGKKANLT